MKLLQKAQNAVNVHLGQKTPIKTMMMIIAKNEKNTAVLSRRNTKQCLFTKFQNLCIFISPCHVDEQIVHRSLNDFKTLISPLIFSKTSNASFVHSSSASIMSSVSFVKCRALIAADSLTSSFFPVQNKVAKCL